MTVPLVLPEDLNDEQRQLLAERQLGLKYSEDQPRDESGRWTSGGGADGAGAEDVRTTNMGTTVRTEDRGGGATGIAGGLSHDWYVAETAPDVSFNNPALADEPALTEAQQKAVDLWESVGGYRAMNDMLRGTSTQPQDLAYPPEKIASAVDELRSAFDAAPVTEEPALVYRGADATFYEGLGVGDVFQDKGFIATEVSEQRAGAFADPTQAALEILLPTGTPYLRLGGGEILLQPDTQFRVVEVDTEPSDVAPRTYTFEEDTGDERLPRGVSFEDLAVTITRRIMLEVIP